MKILENKRQMVEWLVDYKARWLMTACEGAAKRLLVQFCRRQIPMAACCNVNGLASTASLQLAATSDGGKGGQSLRCIQHEEVRKTLRNNR
jgi:hypothetical protein